VRYEHLKIPQKKAQEDLTEARSETKRVQSANEAETLDLRTQLAEYQVCKCSALLWQQFKDIFRNTRPPRNVNYKLPSSLSKRS